MYSRIYFYFKLLFDSDNKKKKRTDVALIIFVYQLIHILFIHELIKKTLNISILKSVFNNDYGTNKLIWIPILFAYTYFLSWYFNHYWDKIKTKYSNRVLIRIKDTFIVISLFVLPLLGLIILFNL